MTYLNLPFVLQLLIFEQLCFPTFNPSWTFLQGVLSYCENRIILGVFVFNYNRRAPSSFCCKSFCSVFRTRWYSNSKRSGEIRKLEVLTNTDRDEPNFWSSTEMTKVVSSRSFYVSSVIIFLFNLCKKKKKPILVLLLHEFFSSFIGCP